MSNVYGFTVGTTNASSPVLNKITSDIKTMSATALAETAKMQKEMHEMAESIKQVGEAIGIAFGVRELIDFGKELLNVTAEYEAFDNVIKFSSLNTIDAQENLSFLHQTIDRLHIPMKQAYEGFSDMEAGLAGTNIQGEKLRKFFEGFSTMAMVQHLSAFRYGNALLDLKEIGEIGLNKRMARSLSVNLPGIKKVVQDTFGKSMNELQAEHMNGGEFLEKLGAGMQKAFAPGVNNALDSLQANMAATSNKMTETMIQMGDNLKPVFIDIMHAIQEAFDSAPVKFFTKNISELVKVVGFSIEVWGIYKGIMIATTVATEGYAVAMKIVEGVQMTAMFGAEGLSVAIGGLGTAFATLGLGAIAAALAVIVNKFIDMGQAVDEANEKLSNLKKLQGEGAGLTSKATEDYDNYRLALSGKLDKQGQGEAYTKAITDAKELSTHLDNLHLKFGDVGWAQSNAMASLVEMQQKFTGSSRERVIDQIQHGDLAGNQNQKAQDLLNTVLNTPQMFTGLGKEIENTKSLLAGVQSYIKAYQVAGVKPPSYPTYESGDASKNHARHTSDLSGGHGGLGEAKTISFHVGIMQQNNGVKESKSKADDAVRIILEGIQNLNYSQSAAI